jgi:hypothetical protein
MRNIGQQPLSIVLRLVRGADRRSRVALGGDARVVAENPASVGRARQAVMSPDLDASVRNGCPCAMCSPASRLGAG